LNSPLWLKYNPPRAKNASRNDVKIQISSDVIDRIKRKEKIPKIAIPQVMMKTFIETASCEPGFTGTDLKKPGVERNFATVLSETSSIRVFHSKFRFQL
jgi:hypothetical protein